MGVLVRRASDVPLIPCGHSPIVIQLQSVYPVHFSYRFKKIYTWNMLHHIFYRLYEFNYKFLQTFVHAYCAQEYCLLKYSELDIIIWILGTNYCIWVCARNVLESFELSLHLLKSRFTFSSTVRFPERYKMFQHLNYVTP